MPSEYVRKEVETLKAPILHCKRFDAILWKTIFKYYELNRNIVVSLGKEINRDIVSSGERTQYSRVYSTQK